MLEPVARGDRSDNLSEVEGRLCVTKNLAPSETKNMTTSWLSVKICPWLGESPLTNRVHVLGLRDVRLSIGVAVDLLAEPSPKC